jgi:regulator of nucleoside diphosphate kinase
MNMQLPLLTEKDAVQLRRMLLARSEEFNGRDLEQWYALEQEIDRAHVIAHDELPPGVVTMHSRVRIVDMRTGEQLVYQIVYPNEANYAQKKISVLAPIGTALLGYAEGTEIEWQVPSGIRRLRIDAVEQPTETIRAKAAA